MDTGHYLSTSFVPNQPISQQKCSVSGGRFCEQHILSGRKKGSRKGLEHIENIGLFI